MHEQLSKRWSLLPLGVEDSVFQLFDKSHPLKFYIGKNAENNRVLMLVVNACPQKIRSMRAINVKSYAREDDGWALVLTLENPILEPMFALLCADLINFSKTFFMNETEALKSVLRRLSFWRLLLERDKNNLLSESEIRGLCGELLFLQKLFKILGEKSALDSWGGPLGAHQDFQTEDCSWEIKTVRPAAINISISSEYQLEVINSPINLIVIELIGVRSLDEENSLSLNNLVENIHSKLLDNIEAYDLFEEKLSHTGYLPRSEYDEFKYRLGSTSAYEITELFPCITSKVLAAGICKVKYDIKISELAKYKTNLVNSI